LYVLFGSAIRATLDDRQTIAVPAIGEEEDGHVNHVPKSMLVSIIAPRVEEIFEMFQGLNSGIVAGLDPRNGTNTTATSLETFVREVFAPAYQGIAVGA
jgi:cell division protein FtsA